MFHYQPAFSRSGRSIAFVRRRLGPRSEIALADVETGTVRSLTVDDALALSPVWSPDDHYIYFSSSRGGTMNIWRMTVATAEAVQITAGQGDDVEVDLSRDGKRLVFSSNRAATNLAEVSLVPSSLGERKWLTRDLSRSVSAPRYSPDGKRIAYFTNRIAAEREGIWVMDVGGSNATQLVEDGRTNIYPRWSPDGQQLYYYSRAPGSMESAADLRRVALAGGAPQVLPIRTWFPFWGWGDIGRDGRLIYRTSETAGELFDPRTNRREPVADLLGDPMWSGDGRSFAYGVRAGGASNAPTPGLWISELGKSRQLFEGWVVWFTWAATGDLFVIEGRPDLKGILWRIAPTGQRGMVMKEIPFFRRPIDINWVARFDVHPDGRRIVIEGLESYEADIGMIDNVR
jgi:hypothetical protein